MEAFFSSLEESNISYRLLPEVTTTSAVLGDIVPWLSAYTTI